METHTVRLSIIDPPIWSETEFGITESKSNFIDIVGIETLLKLSDAIRECCEEAIKTGKMVRKRFTMTYKPIPTTKKEMVEAVDKLCEIGKRPMDELMRDLNYQIGVVKNLANHLPEDKNGTL
jgi:hypothetical protein